VNGQLQQHLQALDGYRVAGALVLVIALAMFVPAVLQRIGGRR
jgi:hypothetical protein